MTDYRDKNEQELTKLLADKREAIQAFNLGLAGGKMKNVREARNLRKASAQILTVLRSKQTK